MNIPGPNAATAEQNPGEPEPRRTVAQVLKDIALFFAAPFVTIAYLALFPFIGVMLLMRDWRRRKNAS
jgi:hypothetical protein